MPPTPPATRAPVKRTMSWGTMSRWLRGWPVGYVSAAILLAALALLWWPYQSDYKVRVTATVSHGRLLEVFFNDFRGVPLRAALVPGERRVYELASWSQAITRLRVDPTETPGSTVAFEALEVLSGDTVVSRFRAADLAAWASSGITPLEADPHRLTVRITNNDPALVSPELTLGNPRGVLRREPLQWVALLAGVMLMAHVILRHGRPGAAVGLPRGGWHTAVSLAAYASVAAILCLRIGQDLTWDLRNYHFYGPYLFLTNRFAKDIYAAGVQSYYNWILDWPMYVAVRTYKVPPLAVSLALGAVQGVNLWLVHRVARLLLADRPQHLASVLAVVAALTSAFGAAFYGLLGSTTGDSIVSLTVLGALAVLLASTERARLRGPLILSGLLIGLGVGAKPMVALYAIGLGAAWLVVRPGSVADHVRRQAYFGAFALFGTLTTAGHWMYTLLRHFGNPLFPHFNALFHSPYAQTGSAHLSIYYGPTDWLTALFYPFLFLSGDGTVAGATNFRDARLVTLALAVVFITTLGRRFGKPNCRLLAVAVFAAVSYIVWLTFLGQYRFIVPLEMLAAAVLVTVIATVIHETRAALAVSLAACLVLVVVTKPTHWGRVPWASTYFGVDETRLTKYRDATIVMSGKPNGFLVPFFPASTKFVRPWALEGGADVGTLMWARLERAVNEANALYSLETGVTEFSEPRLHVFASLGLRRDASRCETISSQAGPTRICALDRTR